MLGGFTGVPPTEIVILGAGTVGEYAARTALSLGAEVKVFDSSIFKLRRLQNNLGNRVFTSVMQPVVLKKAITTCDVVIGAIRSEHGRSPCVVMEETVAKMKPHSVVVDVSIDQGGCFETSHPTTHQNPTFVVDNVVHYCVANMPGAVARTSTQALSHATLPFVLALANQGWKGALQHDAHLRAGLNVCLGKVNYHAVAQAHGYPHVPAETVLA